MLNRFLDALEKSSDALLVGEHWAREIRTFLQGIDKELDAGMPHLEVGVENRLVLKLTLLANYMFTTAHLESLPWLNDLQRGLVREIRKVRTRFQYGLKLLPEGHEFEIYVHETKDHHFRRNIFASTLQADLPDPNKLQAWSLTNRRGLSSYWADPDSRGFAQISPATLKLAKDTQCAPEAWVHYTWDGNAWGPAKTGVQFVPASAELDAALRDAMPDVHFLDVFGTPAARHSAHVATGAGRHCLYMTLNRASA